MFALALSGIKNRRLPYEQILHKVHRVSSCNAYRQLFEGETNEQFVNRKELELEAKFKELGQKPLLLLF